MPRTVRVAVIGLGTVGTWVLRALAAQGERLSRQYGFMPNVVAVSNAHDGLVYRADGIDPAAVLSALSERRSLAELPGVRRWSTALEGLQSLEADMLVEVTSSPRETGEPGSAHMRTALQRGMCVASSNKWPVALHGVELVELARTAGLVFRAESTVMSGTPVLSTLTDGLAGARPIGLRGILNATSNFILSRMTSGQGYEAALAQAQAAGLAERDPSADVDGHDAVAKLMILSGLVFGTQLQFQSVERLGIADLDAAAVRSHVASGGRVRHVATLEPQASSGGSSMRASVRPVFLEAGDPLAAIDGVTNALICRVEPVGEVTIIGPGAGLALAGQGVLSDVIAIGRRFR